MQQGHNSSVMAMADPLKDTIDTLFGIKCRDPEWEDNKDRVVEPTGKTLRFIMQTLATEWGRDLVDPDLWVKLVDSRIPQGVEYVMFQDVRFPNEEKYIRDNGGVLFHVRRPGATPIGLAGHRSEIPLPFRSDLGDVELVNDGPIEKIRHAAVLALHHLIQG